MCYILDRSETEPAPEVDRHHRSPRPRPDPSDPPRPYIVRLLRWSDRQLILRAAAEKGKKLAEKKKRLEWANKPIHVFQDLTPEIQQKRSEYANITRKLRGSGRRYGLLFPARLMVTLDGQKHIYITPEQASKDLTTRLPSIFG